MKKTHGGRQYVGKEILTDSSHTSNDCELCEDDATDFTEADPSDANEIENLKQVADKVEQQTPTNTCRPTPHIWIPSKPIELLNLRVLNQAVVGMYDRRGRLWTNYGPRNEATQRLCAEGRELEQTPHEDDGGALFQASTDHVYVISSNTNDGNRINVPKCAPIVRGNAGLNGSGFGLTTITEPSAGEEHWPWPQAPFYRSVGRLSFYRSDGSLDHLCTATAVGAPNVLISAAHCFFRNGDWKPGMDWNAGERMRFRPGYDADNPEPFGAHLVTWVWVPSKWINKESYYRDWALVAINSHAPVEYYGAAAKGYSDLQGSDGSLTAYPSTANGHQYQDKGEIRRVYVKSIRHKCYSEDGSSGGAIVHWHRDGPYVVAVNDGNRFCSSCTHWNIGTRITPDRVESIVNFVDWLN